MTGECGLKAKNPMHEARQALEHHPKCGAHARTTGKSCRNPAMENGRCRMHGGKSTGRPLIHGFYTKDRKSKLKVAKEILRNLRDTIKGF